MNAAGSTGGSTFDVEALLSAALRPIEPPETLSSRVESALTRITDAAAEELADWEIETMRDPRNWVKPLAAAAAGSAAAAGLVVLETRRRHKDRRGAADPPVSLERLGTELGALADEIQSRFRSR